MQEEKKDRRLNINRQMRKNKETRKERKETESD